jgi:hypothetical protein
VHSPSVTPPLPPPPLQLRDSRDGTCARHLRSLSAPRSSNDSSDRDGKEEMGWERRWERRWDGRSDRMEEIGWEMGWDGREKEVIKNGVEKFVHNF